VANSLWGQKDYKWLQPFLETCKANYGSGLTEVDFKTAFEEARVKINKWVEEKTNEKIKDLIPVGGLNNLTCLVLVNAIWFKGDWKSQFKKEATKDEPFWNSGTEKVTAPLMHQKQDFKYLEAEGVQLLEMPYVGEKVSMVVILPKEKAGLGKVEAGLTGVKLEQWLKTLDQARAQEVQVYLPKFTLTYGTKEMMKSFEALGMTLPFQGGSADFSGMDGQKGLCISKIFHKAFVAVDEEGTEAAAATAVVMTRTSVPPPPPVFRADHPFVFLIRDKTNGNILFLGRLAKP
jgi:serpin B